MKIAKFSSIEGFEGTPEEWQRMFPTTAPISQQRHLAEPNSGSPSTTLNGSQSSAIAGLSISVDELRRFWAETYWSTQKNLIAALIERNGPLSMEDLIREAGLESPESLRGVLSSVTRNVQRVTGKRELKLIVNVRSADGRWGYQIREPEVNLLRALARSVLEDRAINRRLPEVLERLLKSSGFEKISGPVPSPSCIDLWFVPRVWEKLSELRSSEGDAEGRTVMCWFERGCDTSGFEGNLGVFFGIVRGANKRKSEALFKRWKATGLPLGSVYASDALELGEWTTLWSDTLATESELSDLDSFQPVLNERWANFVATQLSLITEFLKSQDRSALVDIRTNASDGSR
jgi:hypothetical protein